MIDLLAIGGAHIDRTAQTLERHIAGASNPARISESVGGGAFNALRNAKLLNISTSQTTNESVLAMMSIRGGDSAGQLVEDAIDRAGLIDLGGTFVDRHTPSYSAILDISGELVTAIADMHLYETGFSRQVDRLEGRREISKARYVLVDANLPTPAIGSVVNNATGPVFAMCISPAKAKRLLPVINKFDIIFLNRRELTSLTQDAELGLQLDRLLELGVGRAIITNGSKDLSILEAGSTRTLNVPRVEQVVDVTGAGDSLAGVTIAALMKNPELSLADAACYGIAAAQMTLQVKGPICDAIAMPAFDLMHKDVVAAQSS